MPFERFRRIADAQTDELRIGVRSRVSFTPARNFGKEIARSEIGKASVSFYHNRILANRAKQCNKTTHTPRPNHGNQFLPKRSDVEFFEKRIPLQFFDFRFRETGHKANFRKRIFAFSHQLCRFSLCLIRFRSDIVFSAFAYSLLKADLFTCHT